MKKFTLALLFLLSLLPVVTFAKSKNQIKNKCIPCKACPATPQNCPALALHPLNNRAQSIVLPALSSAKITSAVGIVLYDLSSNQEIYTLNPDKLFIPASISKMFTSAAALKNLGVSYSFKTEIKYKGELQSNGKLDGDLYIIGGGDPFLVSEKLERLSANIYYQGLRKVEGDLCVDNSFFQDVAKLRDNFETEIAKEDNPYNAQNSALSFNFNSLGIYISPLTKVTNAHSSIVGENEIPIYIDPIENSYIKIHNNLRLGAGTSATLLRLNKNNNTAEEFSLQGESSSPSFLYKSVNNPALYAGHMLKALLQKNNITISGEVKECPPEKNLTSLFTHASDSLAELVTLTNRFSNNFMCEQILLTMGAHRFGAPGTPDKGLMVLGEYLKSINFKKRDYIFKNGSGLTYGNQLSARHAVELLNAIHNDYTIYPEFLYSLARPHIAGTLNKWFNNDSEMEVVRAKTGSLSHRLLVHSIAGIVAAKNGHLLAFAMITNIPSASKEAYKSYALARLLEEKILIMLAKWEN
ncbi:MAG: D-alanyl-D-alanine carboxypeptidase/D-alanyl-D-alanine-endopeptidase [Oligoflexia bacterium]|nr:D-alanyl-D-alanine carboxypeptidase/D-alanyl-D-alanine-endopeptidase [Oligoflexia bacterium]MBF0364283.1 D-alanyl-D-alanine carboxypeptidase/D-alanyl-D-alanine-endopeptidase [Oligoflexia bacterium]